MTTMRSSLFSRRSIRQGAVLAVGSTKIKLLLACCVVLSFIAFSGRTASFMGWEQNAVSMYPSSLPRKGYTILMNTWKRNDLLKQSISHYATCPGLDSVHIVWSEPDLPSDSLVNFLTHVVKQNSKGGREIELKFDINVKDSLNNRFKEIKDLESDVVFSIDDDIIFPCTTVEFAFRTWQSAPDTMVGFVPRIHWVDKSKSDQDTYIYSGWWSVWWTGTYSMILSKAAFFHKKYLNMYTYEMPSSIREYVTKNRNCEDIAMSFLVANATRAPPIWVKAINAAFISWVYSISRCWGNKISSSFTPLRTVYLGGHNSRRSHCVNRFSVEYGGMPLVSTSVKAVDSRFSWFW